MERAGRGQVGRRLRFPFREANASCNRKRLARSIGPKLDAAGLEWVTFQVMRRTSSTLLNSLGVEGKIEADQLRHTLDVNQNVYTHSPVALRREALNKLEQALA